MKTKSLISIIFLGLLVFTGCNKDDFLGNTENKISSKNEKLTDVAHFSSLEHFKSSIESLKNTGILPIEMNGVVSLS